MAGTTLPVDDQDYLNQINDDSHAEDDLADVETHFCTVSGFRKYTPQWMQAALRDVKKECERPPLVTKDIVARIRPEPDNEKDTKAIVSEGYKAIGYLPRELS